MCFDFDASPPYLPSELALAPVAGGAATELLELTSTDGTSFSAALAPTAESKGPGVVILPDVRGLYPFYSELSERFAQAGHDAIAIDYFGRTAGLGPRDEKFDFWPHVQDSDPALIQQDAAAAVAAMRERAGVEKVVSVGFCFGGAQSLLAGTNAELGLDGVVAFYGALDGERLGIISPPDVVDQMRAPILGLYGGADQSIPVEAVDDFESKLDAAGKDHDITIYPGAPHSFFDRTADEHAGACEDAWRRVLGFLGRFA